MKASNEKTIYGKLEVLFNISNLSESSKKIMAQAALLPVRGISAAIFLRTHDEIEQDKIRILEFSGWLKKSTDNFLSIHPLVRQICIPKIKQAELECKTFIENYSRGDC